MLDLLQHSALPSVGSSASVVPPPTESPIEAAMKVDERSGARIDVTADSTGGVYAVQCVARTHLPIHRRGGRKTMLMTEMRHWPGEKQMQGALAGPSAEGRGAGSLGKWGWLPPLLFSISAIPYRAIGARSIRHQCAPRTPGVVCFFRLPILGLLQSDRRCAALPSSSSLSLPSLPKLPLPPLGSGCSSPITTPRRRWPPTGRLRGFLPSSATMPCSSGLGPRSCAAEQTSVVFSPSNQWWVPEYPGSRCTSRLAPDSSLALVWGVAVVDREASSSFPATHRIGRLLAAWRPVRGSWEIGALAFSGLLRGAETLWSDSLGAREWPLLRSVGAARHFIAADSAFAAMAGMIGAGKAFTFWASSDAVTFSGTGELSIGPAAIGAGFVGDANHWAWGAVAAGASLDGSLGWTVGQAVITGQGPDGKALVSRSKYLTLWQRQRDGSVRFISDGGNGRP